MFFSKFLQNVVDKQLKNCIVQLNVFRYNFIQRVNEMAKAVKILVKLESTAGTGTFYVAEKNPRTHPEKLTMKKYDKKSKKHEEFVEKKMK